MRSEQELRRRLTEIDQREREIAQGITTIVPTVRDAHVPRHYQALADEYPSAFLAGIVVGQRRMLLWVLDYIDAKITKPTT